MMQEMMVRDGHPLPDGRICDRRHGATHNHYDSRCRACGEEISTIQVNDPKALIGWYGGEKSCCRFIYKDQD